MSLVTSTEAKSLKERVLLVLLLVDIVWVLAVQPLLTGIQMASAMFNQCCLHDHQSFQVDPLNEFPTFAPLRSPLIAARAASIIFG